MVQLDVFAQKIDECAHPRRQRSALPEEDGVDVFAVTRIELFEHWYQPASFNVGADMKQRQPRQANAAKRERACGLAVARARRRRW